jgi:phosphoserine phosphatase RsbU/P
MPAGKQPPSFPASKLILAEPHRRRHRRGGMSDGGSAGDHDRALKLERLELALKASHEGIWDWWIDRREIYYSRRILEFLECGSGHAPHLFLPPYEAIHPEERRNFEAALALALMDGGPELFAADARVRCGGGSWRWLQIRGTVVRDRDGKALRIAGSMIDITRRMLAESQVEDERFLLRQLIDHIPLQVYFKDLSSRFVMANKGMADWMGLPDSAALVGRHDRDFFGEDHWKPAEADELRILSSGEPITGKLEHETWKEGEETWVLTSKFPWRDRHGRIKGTFGVSSDVTSLVRAQREATGLARELQHKNAAYEEELQLAREIQQTLTVRTLPELADARHRVAFGSRYIPITGLAGDFFEVLPLGPGTAGVLICDVMGHGVRAALIVAMLRGLLETQRARAADPAAFLAGLNHGLSAILERAGITIFATAFYAVIDLPAGELRFACAGHPGPIVADAEGVRQIATARDAKGPALGLFREVSYPAQVLDLATLRRLVLFTDGVLEAENRQGEPFFEKRLIDLVAARCEEPLDAMLETILASVLGFSESRHFDDDVCLLAVDFTRAQP